MYAIRSYYGLERHGDAAAQVKAAAGKADGGQGCRQQAASRRKGHAGAPMQVL